MTTTCQYCDREFSSLSNLKYHQKHARYCLQNRSNGVMEGTKCDFCKKILGSKYNLQLHHKTCPEKKVNSVKLRLNRKKKDVKSLSEEIEASKLTIQKLKDENLLAIKKLKNENLSLKGKILELEGVITGLKTAPDKKTIYNTAYVHPKLANLPISNIPALTQEYITERVNDGILTYEKAAKGYLGILDVIGDLITHENEEGIIERSYVCTDASRNSFHRLLESKKWKADKGGRYLNNILETFRDVMKEYKNRVYDKYENTHHESIEWYNVEWERKNISLLYIGIVCMEGASGRDELVNILKKEISKKAYIQ